MKIVELKKRMDLFEQAVDAFWEQWGMEGNYTFYEDTMRNSAFTEEDLPRFYVALEEEEIIGTYALLRNDFVSRQDLYPWFACLLVTPESRGNGLGGVLLQHALEEAGEKGYSTLYLTTELDNYYEKYGWVKFADAFGIDGHPTKIYSKRTRNNQ